TTVFRKPEVYALRSFATTVHVKPLPPHPLRDKLPVGEYRLREKADHTNLKTGKSCRYEFTIFGEGNINTITSPATKENSNLELYTPEITQTVYRKKYPLSGTKDFEYY